MKVLVLGGSGFIGSNLCNRLLKMGHYVRVLQKSIKKTDFHSPQIELIVGDFSEITDFKTILKDIDVVFHLISTTVPATSNQNKEFDIISNVCSTLRLLEDIVHTGNKKIVFLSSGGTVYGQSDKSLILEEHQNNPICSYGIQKLTIEKYLYYFKHEYGLNYQIVRLSNPYGKGQYGRNGQGIIPIFISKIVTGEEILVWGDGSNTRDYIYIDDVVNALELLINYMGDVRVFNLGSGVGTTINDLIEIISQVLGKTANVRYIEARGFDVKRNVLDISKISKELEWRPTVDLKSGISLMVKNMGLTVAVE